MDWLNFRGAIFDVDGTILDSMHIWTEIDRQFLARRGIEMPHSLPDELNALGLTACCALIKSRYALADSIESMMREIQDMSLHAYAHELQLKPGALAYLQRLCARGIKIAVATALDPALFQPVLERTGVAALVSAITCLKDVTRSKEFPDIYLRAADMLGLAADACIVFEDYLTCVRSAKTGGFRVVAVSDDFSRADEQTIRDVSDLYIDGFLDESVLP